MAGAGDEPSEVAVASGGVVGESDIVAQYVAAVVVAGEHPAVWLVGSLDRVGLARPRKEGIRVLLAGGAGWVEREQGRPSHLY